MSEIKKRILVVEDDAPYREMIAALLQKKGFETKTAANGKLALQELSFTMFDLVISDIKMPVMHGLDLLLEVKKRFPQMPVILMTGFSYILETQEAQTLGADDFILKPFQTTDFLRLVYKYCGQMKVDQEERVDLSHEYFAIPIDEFVTGSHLMYDVFIKLTKFKFLKIASVDDVLERDTITKYKNKDIQFLYINKNDYRLYLGMNIQVYRAVEGNKKFDKSVHAHLITNIVGMFSALTFEGCIDDTLEGEIKEFCIKGFSLISEHDDLMKILSDINKISKEESTHAVSVAFIATSIAKKLGWYSKGTAHKLYLAAILHDIGKKNFTEELMRKSPTLMSKEEYSQYKEHSTLGKDILIDLKAMPTDTVKAVYEHHESYNGTGFPNGAKREFIHPLARVIHIADDFCRYVYSSSGNEMSVVEAIRLMNEHNRPEYDPQFYNAFLQIFKKQILDLQK